MRTVLGLARELAGGAVSAAELADAALAQAAAPTFIAVTAERARAEAAASDARRARGASLGPLDGIPLVWKDILDVAGTVTTAGSELRRELTPATADAPIVARLAAAGMVCVGKTNMSELAFSGLGLNPHFGTPPNPHDPQRAPGGSSSGTGAAVGAGIVPVGIGTDTAGSVRIPASFCGVTGLRTSGGRIDRTTVVPLAGSLDAVGPLASDVMGCLLADRALRGAPLQPDPAPPQPGTLRLVVPAIDAEPGVTAAVERALTALEDAGAQLERRELAALTAARQLFARHGALGPAEAGRLHAELIASSDAARLDPRVLARLRLGREISDADLHALLAARGALSAAIADELGGALLVTPTTPHVAPLVSELADDDAFHAINLRTLALTGLLSYLDMPGVSLPAGPAEAGMPAGLLLSDASGSDDALLASALSAEAVLQG